MLTKSPTSLINRLPSWFKQDIPDQAKTFQMRKLLDKASLNTVCESAHCPNIGKCWGEGIATFMILGDTCSRDCRFCAVKNGIPKMVDIAEPKNVAFAVKEMNLSYVVITSVTRDDLKDKGADQFAKTVSEVRSLNLDTKVEVLIPDMGGEKEYLSEVVAASPDVIGHNIETVERLFPLVRPKANYDRSLKILKYIKEMDPSILVKSSFMVGLGESSEEITKVMQDLLAAGCDILAIGQYLSPSKTSRHCKVERYVPPEEFDRYKTSALAMGFKHVASSPLVRSSFLAEESYNSCV